MKIAKDKIMHTGVCCIASLVIAMIVSSVGGDVAPSLAAGLLGALAMGVGKEYGDMCYPGNRWDWQDMLADAVGGIAGVVLGLIILLFL